MSIKKINNTTITKLDIKKLVFDQFHVYSKEKITENSVIKEIKGIDSLDLVELITYSEEKLGIQIDDEELEKIKLVGDIIKILENKIEIKNK